MSEEIRRNTEKYFKNPNNTTFLGHCYFNTSQNTMFWRKEEIKTTTNVYHLVRVENLDYGPPKELED